MYKKTTIGFKLKEVHEKPLIGKKLQTKFYLRRWHKKLWIFQSFFRQPTQKYVHFMVSILGLVRIECILGLELLCTVLNICFKCLLNHKKNSFEETSNLVPSSSLSS